MKKAVKTGPVTTYGFIANVDGNTVKNEGFLSRDEATEMAERCMKVGIWETNRLYPPMAIVYIEIFEKTV